MRKPRQYRRPLKQEELHALKFDYADLLNSKRGGCLGSYRREWLLNIRLGNKDQDTDSKKEYETKAWSNIKQTAQDAMKDLALICDVANDQMIGEIFYEENKKTGKNPFTTLISKILFPDNLEGEAEEANAWRNEARQHFLAKVIDWYINSGVLRIESLKRTMNEAMEIVNSTSEKDWKRKFDSEREEKALPYYMKDPKWQFP